MPFRFFVFSTTIYDLLVTRVPRYDAATALAVLVLAAMLPLIFAQQWLTRGRRYTTVTGQFQNKPHALGRLALARRSPSCWRWSLVVLGAPVRLRAARHLHEALRLLPRARAVDARELEDRPRPTTSSCARCATRSCSPSAPRWRPCCVHSLIAYIAVRTRYAGRRLLDFISWLPFTVPGDHPRPGAALALPRRGRSCGRSTAPPRC